MARTKLHSKNPESKKHRDLSKSDSIRQGAHRKNLLLKAKYRWKDEYGSAESCMGVCDEGMSPRGKDCIDCKHDESKERKANHIIDPEVWPIGDIDPDTTLAALVGSFDLKRSDSLQNSSETECETGVPRSSDEGMKVDESYTSRASHDSTYDVFLNYQSQIDDGEPEKGCAYAKSVENDVEEELKSRQTLTQISSTSKSKEHAEALTSLPKIEITALDNQLNVLRSRSSVHSIKELLMETINSDKSDRIGHNTEDKKLEATVFEPHHSPELTDIPPLDLSDIESLDDESPHEGNTRTGETNCSLKDRIIKSLWSSKMVVHGAEPELSPITVRPQHYVRERSHSRLLRALHHSRTSNELESSHLCENCEDCTYIVGSAKSVASAKLPYNPTSAGSNLITRFYQNSAFASTPISPAYEIEGSANFINATLANNPS